MKIKPKFYQLNLQVNDTVDLWLSRYLSIKDIETVCLTLGPYRNLTTLTGSILFLHKNCQVLNHAGQRIYNNKNVNFLFDYKKKKLDRFLQYAIKISKKGRRGDFGGSITLSHAFDPQYALRELYENSGEKLVKKKITCLFWKESLRTTNYIQDNKIDLSAILERESRLRFLLPIRNPLDCAVSNLNTGHYRLFRQIGENPSIFDVVKAILDEIIFFVNHKKYNPNRFFYFYEHSISRNMLISLSNFLRLELDHNWVSTALYSMKLNPGYKHDSILLKSYRHLVEEKCEKLPELKKNLLLFAGN